MYSSHPVVKNFSRLQADFMRRREQLYAGITLRYRVRRRVLPHQIVDLLRTVFIHAAHFADILAVEQFVITVRHCRQILAQAFTLVRRQLLTRNVYGIIKRITLGLQVAGQFLGLLFLLTFQIGQRPYCILPQLLIVSAQSIILNNKAL